MRAPGETSLSVIIPVFNEEANIPLLLPRLYSVLEKIQESWEVIFVNDGSTDRTLDLLEAETSAKPHLVIVNLARNFGQHAAVMAGFAQAAGRWVITMDADLQNPPEEIPRVLEELRKGHDLVGTVRKSRQDSVFRRAASRITNRLITSISGISLGDFGCMLRGYSQEVVQAILENQEYRTFIPALATFFAADPVEIQVGHEERAMGESKYSLVKLLSLQLDLMTGFSMWPLRILFFVGSTVAVMGVVLALMILAMRFYHGPGWAAQGVFTLFAIMFFLTGCQLFALGLVGEYVGRIFQAVRHRPAYIVEKVFRCSHGKG